MFPVALHSPVLAFIEGIGGMELMLVMVLALVLFGGKGLPNIARGLGRAVREFKKATSGVEEEFKRALNTDDEADTPRPPRPRRPASISPPAPATPPSPNTPPPRAPEETEK